MLRLLLQKIIKILDLYQHQIPYYKVTSIFSCIILACSQIIIFFTNAFFGVFVLSSISTIKLIVIKISFPYFSCKIFNKLFNNLDNSLLYLSITSLFFDEIIPKEFFIKPKPPKVTGLEIFSSISVSYTHLTLPTKRIV